MTEDPGLKIGRMAKALSRDALMELLAIHELDLWMPARVRTRTYVGNLERQPILGLLADKLLWRQNPIKTGSAVLHLTEFGQRVMLARVDYELGEAEL